MPSAIVTSQYGHRCSSGPMAVQDIVVMASGMKPLITPTIRQISVAKIPVIFDLNRSLQGFDKPGVADVCFKCPNRICKKSITLDNLNSLNVSAI